MKNLLDRLAKLAQGVLACAALAVLLGLPAMWVGIVSFLVLDIAGIAWADQKSSGGKKGRRSNDIAVLRYCGARVSGC